MAGRPEQRVQAALPRAQPLDRGADEGPPACSELQAPAAAMASRPVDDVGDGAEPGGGRCQSCSMKTAVQRRDQFVMSDSSANVIMTRH